MPVEEFFQKIEALMPKKSKKNYDDDAKDDASEAAVVPASEESNVGITSNAEPSIEAQFIKLAQEIVNSKFNPEEKNTHLAILFEGFYQFMCTEKKHEALKNKLLEIRKWRWKQNYSVPTVNFLLTHASAIEETKKYFGVLQTAALVQEKPWQISKTNKQVIDPSNEVWEDPKAFMQVEEPAPEENKKFIKTLNNQGYMTTKLDKFSQFFVNHAGSLAQQGGAVVLEIGAAYGVATLDALKKGARVFCNDLDPRQLAVVQNKWEKLNASDDKTAQLVLIPGAFPEELQFSEKFDAILICRVLHFFDGKKIEEALAQAKNWLKPKGKIYVVAETPYLKNWEKFIPDFEGRKTAQEKYPGFLTKADMETYADPSRLPYLPNQVHWIHPDTLQKMLKDAGFSCDQIGFIDRKDEFPSDLILDGRESVGAVASVKHSL